MRTKLLLPVFAIIIMLVAWLAIFGGGLFGSHDGGSPSLFESPKENVSIAVTGDVMFARNMPAALSFGYSPFAGVSNVTSNVDLLLINFENAATTSENAVKGDVPLKCSPDYVPLAKANNLTVAALANNHAFDYGT
ncbi:MAG: CapA family protein, partial [Candidatus Riflebacteria bacterium]|nr:CapA family protein [Candidatus Riflebacteria bacterium]